MSPGMIIGICFLLYLLASHRGLTFCVTVLKNEDDNQFLNCSLYFFFSLA
jgi:hypothetical protein